MFFNAAFLPHITSNKHPVEEKGFFETKWLLFCILFVRPVFYGKDQHPDFLPLPLKQEQNKTKHFNNCTICCGNRAWHPRHGGQGALCARPRWESVRSVEAQVQSGWGLAGVSPDSAGCLKAGFWRWAIESAGKGWLIQQVMLSQLANHLEGRKKVRSLPPAKINWRFKCRNWNLKKRTQRQIFT